MKKPWLKFYPSASNECLSFSTYQSMPELFDNTIEKYRDNIAYINFFSELTYGQVSTYSRDFAAYLQQELKIKKSDRIALMCPNGLAFVVAMWGIIRTGAIQVNVNPLYSGHELEHQLNEADVDTVIVFANSTSVLADIVDKTFVKNIIVIGLDDLVNKNLPSIKIDERLTKTTLFVDALQQGENLTFSAPKLQKQDVLFLQYTGGTTGLSKGAMLTHGNIIANILQYEALAKSSIDYGGERVLTAIPMYHIFALTINGLAYFSFGASNTLITNPRDMVGFVETWKHFKPTFFTGVNTMFNGLLHARGFADIDFSELKMTIGGGAPVQQAVSDKWQSIVGKGIFEGYGLSETSPVLTVNLGFCQPYVSGIGIPVPGTDISIRDEHGREVAQGEAGELCAKGPQVMLGYWRNSADTAECMTEDGFFKTGDIAVLDDAGHFHIVDRKKDMVLVSGFNVYPAEIEAELAKMSGIVECACIGISDDVTGEAVKVFVVKDQPAINGQQVREFCRLSLTAYKVPKHVEFLDELPKSTVGKILRRSLREIK